MNLTYLCERLKEFQQAVTNAVMYTTTFTLTGNPKFLLEAYEAEEVLHGKTADLFTSIMGRPPTRCELEAILHLGN